MYTNMAFLMCQWCIGRPAGEREVKGGGLGISNFTSSKGGPWMAVFEATSRHRVLIGHSPYTIEQGVLNRIPTLSLAVQITLQVGLR